MNSSAFIPGLAAAPFALLGAWAFERARAVDSLKALRRVEQGDATLMPLWFWASPMIAAAGLAGAASELGIVGVVTVSLLAFLPAMGVWRSVRAGLLQVAAGGVVLQQFVPRAVRPLSVVRMPQSAESEATSPARLAWRARSRSQQLPRSVAALTSDSLLGAVRESPLNTSLLIEHARSLLEQSQPSQALFELRLAAVLRPWDRAPKEMIGGLLAEHVDVAAPDEPATSPHRPDIAGLRVGADAPPLVPPQHRVTILDAPAFVDVLIHAQGQNLFFAWAAPEDQRLPESLLPWTAQYVSVGLLGGSGDAVWTILLDEESVPMLARHVREHSESWRSAALVTAEEALVLADLQWMTAILSCPAFCREYAELRRSGAVKANPEVIGLKSTVNA
jgi:hypothetical protein